MKNNTSFNSLTMDRLLSNRKSISYHADGRPNKLGKAIYSAFTCASSMNYTLMKYFEIPGSGALLFAEKTKEFSELGFVDGVHYVAVTLENYQERMLHYLKGEGHEKAEQIRLEGHEFVRQNHTWEKRISIFLDEVQSLLDQ